MLLFSSSKVTFLIFFLRKNNKYISVVALTVILHWQGIGDMSLAYQCFRLSLSSNNDHAEAYNNLGVLEMRKGHIELVS